MSTSQGLFGMLPWTFTGVSVILFSALIWAMRHYMLGLPYPPNPPLTELISRNRKDFSIPSLWRVCAEWGKTYGNILYLRVFTQPVIVLNSLEDATELLEKRSQNYSSRPVVPMYDLMGYSFITGVKTYGPELRHHRRIFEQAFKYDATLSYRPIQTEKMANALYGLLTSPKEFNAHIKTYAGAIILAVMYGYDVAPKDDKFVILSESSDVAFSQGPSPKWMVNTFPILRYLPSWFPGTAFKRYASSVNLVLTEQQAAPYQYVIDSLASGSARASVVSNYLEKCKSDTDYAMLRQVAASGYSAGVGTTASMIVIFLIAMITFPEVQKKGQREIDNITDGDRLPEYGDQSSLPYIEAIFREVIRWKPIVPLGLPHVNKENDFYNGYYIPKDTIIHPNIWAMSHDPVKYKDPETFNPDRFFNEDGELTDDHVDYAFGFGRRICPGQHLGSASVWLAMATILSTFNVGKKKDESGNDIPLEVEFSDSGILNYPLPFECSMLPRSERSKQLILDAYKRYT